MTADDEVLQRLDKIIALLQLANEDAIQGARARIRADKVNAELLKVASKEVPAGKLVKTVAAKTKQSERSVQAHIAQLIQDGVLEKIGGGPATSYRATGLV